MSLIKFIDSKSKLTSLIAISEMPVFVPFWENATSPITNYTIQGSATIREDDNGGSYGLSTSDLNGINSIVTYDYYRGNVNLAGSTSLTSINLAYVDSVDLSNCTSLEQAFFTSQWSQALDVNFSGCSALTSISAFYVNQINIDGADSLQTLSLQHGLFSDLDVSGKTSLTSLSLTSNYNLQSLNASDCTNLSIINFPTNLTTLNDLKLDNTPITNLNFAFTFIGASIDFSIAGCTNLTSVNCYYNYMSQNIIDGILVDLDTNGASNGYVNLKCAPWNPVPPSSIGLTAAQNLTSRGWNVVIDISAFSFWTGASSAPSSYSYTGGTVYVNGNDLEIDDIAQLQSFDSSASGPVGGTVNVSGAISLTTLNLSNNGITSLDVTGCTALTDLNVSANAFLDLGSQLASISQLAILNVSFGLLTGSTLDLSGLTQLTSVNAHWSYIGNFIIDNGGNSNLNLDLSNCTSLTNFSAENSNIFSINLSGSNNITTIGPGTGNWQYAFLVDLTNCNLTAANLNIILGNLASAMSPTNANGALLIEGNTQDGTTAGYIATIQANGWFVIQ